MSTTFRVTGAPEPSLKLLALPCGACGGHSESAVYTLAEDQLRPADPACPECVGYGGCSEAEDRYFGARGAWEFNVAEANGWFLLRDVLGLGSDPEPCGEVDPATVLRQVAVYRLDPSRGVRTPEVHRAVRVSAEGVAAGPEVHDAGRSAAQVERYLAELERLAELATARGARVAWC